ncbi:MAG: sugar transferase [Bacteroidota bacterium]
MKGSIYKTVIKPLADRFFALALLLLLWPVMLLTAMAVFLFGGRGPIVFKQQRAGFKGQLFEILKFRTMEVIVPDYEEDAPINNPEFYPVKARVTKAGKFLRLSSLDELPQLINVLKGDMSIVGPRPLLPEYLPLYSVLQAQRHKVKPGITGLSQVLGRNAVSWQRRLATDVVYVRKQSFCLDCYILLLTLFKLLKGPSETEHADMQAFTG